MTAPDGREWRVSQSVSWPTQRFGTDLTNLQSIDVGPTGDSLWVGLALLVVTVMFVLLLPFIVLALEALVVVFLTLLALRTWIVRAECSDGTIERWQVRGAFRAHRAVREVARELASGMPAAPGDDPRAIR